MHERFFRALLARLLTKAGAPRLSQVRRRRRGTRDHDPRAISAISQARREFQRGR
jgi:hypothetical protein